jgi:hypothetical protein
LENPDAASQSMLMDETNKVMLTRRGD